MIVIEHLDSEMFEWSLMEYKDIAKRCGKVMFTNVPKKDHDTLKDLGEAREESVKELKLSNAVLLDPTAPTVLKTSDNFDYYIIGGILGNHPMDGRTSRDLGFIGEKRNLGTVQMSTNTAAIVVQRIIEGKSFEDLEFKDGLSIEISPGFFNDLPYRYLVDNGEVVLPSGFLEFLKRQEDNTE